VRLTEDYMKQLDSELGWATLDCVRLRMQYTDRNFLGTARRLQLSGQSSKIGYGDPLASESSRRVCDLNGKNPIRDDPFSRFLNYSLAMAIQQPRLLGTRWVPALSLYSERRGEYKAYLRTIGIGADLSATRDIGDRTPLRVGYTFEYGQTEADPPALCALFNRCDLVSRQQIQERLPLGVANATVLRLRTDNAISPTRGTLMRAELRSSASRILGTDSSLFFNKGTGDVAWYTPVGRSVLTLRLRGGAVLGRRLALDEATPFVPPQERLYAGGPTSVRGFQQNELGSVVYIADREERDGRAIVDSTMTAVAGDSTELTYRFVDPSGNPSRSVPLGGNALVVANIEYRIPDPFLFPRSLQYALFVDGGDVWDRSARRLSMKWTPGFGLRALTPFGPFQVNVGYNHYRRERGAIFYNPNVFTLACATPDPANALRYRRSNDNRSGPLEQVNDLLDPSDDNLQCPEAFTPASRKRWYQRLAFTFSIGPEF
jgi:outer membrane protein insertion porin family/translocation and assembly module TamA